MPNFAAIGVATERVLGWPRGLFTAVYELNRQQQSAPPPADRAFIALLLAFVQAQTIWEGTAQNLLLQLQEYDAHCAWNEEEVDLPTHPNHLTLTLRRLEPHLREQGCQLTFTRNKRECLLRCELIQNAE